MEKLRKLFSLQFILFILSLIIISAIKSELSLPLIILYASLLTILIAGLVIVMQLTSIVSVLLLLFLYLIILFVRIQSVNNVHSSPEIYTKKDTRFSGFVTDYHSTKKNSVVFKYKATHIDIGGSFIPIKPFIILVKIKNGIFPYTKWDTLIIHGFITIPEDKEMNGFNYRQYLLSKGVSATMNVKSNSIRPVSKKITFFQIFKPAGLARVWMLQKFRNLFNDESYSFLLSIFFGDRSLLTTELEGNYRNTGMIHLLAISGFHIGFIGMLFFTLFSFFLPKNVSRICASFILFIYILLLNDSASSMRAFLMYSIQSLYFFSGNKTGKLTPISYSGILMILVNPYCIFDIGFVLSYLATGGILLYAEIINDILEKWCPEKIRGSLAVSISAFIVTFMIQASLFNKIPFFSILSGLVVIPLFTFLFIGLFLVSSIILICDIHFFTGVVQLVISLFNKIILYLSIIKPVDTIEIPLWIPYFFSLLLFVMVYIVPVLYYKLNRIDKLNKIVTPY